MDVTLQPVGHGLVEQGGADYRSDHFVEVGQPFDGVGQGCFVDVGLNGYDPIANCLVGGH